MLRRTELELPVYKRRWLDRRARRGRKRPFNEGLPGTLHRVTRPAVAAGVGSAQRRLQLVHSAYCDLPYRTHVAPKA